MVPRYDGKEFVNFTTENGLSYNKVLAIHGDRGGAIWFGTSDFSDKEAVGVSRYDGSGFASFTKEDGLGGTL